MLRLRTSLGDIKNSDFGKPIIAVVNLFAEFVPGHVYLQDVGRIVCDEIWKQDEFNTIAIDDGIVKEARWHTVFLRAAILSPTILNIWRKPIVLTP